MPTGWCSNCGTKSNNLSYYGDELLCGKCRPSSSDSSINGSRITIHPAGYKGYTTCGNCPMLGRSSKADIVVEYGNGTIFGLCASHAEVMIAPDRGIETYGHTVEEYMRLVAMGDDPANWPINRRD